MGEFGSSIDVAQRWVEAMDDSDLDSVMPLYDPGATLHVFGGTVSGRTRSRVPSIDEDRPAHARGGPEERPGPHRWRRGHHEQMETALRVARCQIAEQWLFGPGEVEL